MNILLLLVILFQMETKKEAFSVELQQYVLSQPVCVIRGLATALKLGTFTSENLAYFTASNFYQNIIVLFSWLFPSRRVGGMTDGIPTPCRPVHLLACSQSSTYHASLVRTFPSCFLVVLSSVSLVYPFSTLSSVCVLHVLFSIGLDWRLGGNSELWQFRLPLFASVFRRRH